MPIRKRILRCTAMLSLVLFMQERASSQGTAVHRNMEPSLPSSSAIDVQQYSFSLELSDKTNYIRGMAVITLRVDKNVDAVPLDLVRKNEQTGRGMLVGSVTENGHALRFIQDSQHLHIYPDRTGASGQAAAS